MCADIVRACEGNKLISMASTPPRSRSSRTAARLPLVLLKLVSSNVALQLRTRPHGVGTKFVLGTSLKNNEVSKVIYEDFLPQVPADGRTSPFPNPSWSARA